MEAPSPSQGGGTSTDSRRMGGQREGIASLLQDVGQPVPRAPPWLDPSGLLLTKDLARLPPADTSGDLLGVSAMHATCTGGSCLGHTKATEKGQGEADQSIPVLAVSPSLGPVMWTRV